jgi:hypothetical protein
VEQRSEIRGVLLDSALKTGATGMYLNEAGSTVYVLAGQLVERAEFDQFGGMAHLSPMGLGVRPHQVDSSSGYGPALVAPAHVFNLASPFRGGHGYNFMARLKVGLIAFGVRTALKMGYLVLITGSCGTGKSVILERAIQGCVLNRTQDVFASMEQGEKPCLLKYKIPDSVFAVDEFEALDRATIKLGLARLGDRPFAAAVQSQVALEDLGVTRWIASRRRVEITLRRN